MPYINVRLIDENLDASRKATLIAGITEVMVRVLGKDPASTFVVIDPVPLENWGCAGESVLQRRLRHAESGR